MCSGYIYEPFGFPGRSLACGLPLAALVAYYVQPVYDFAAWNTTFVVVLLPTFCVYGSCFDYARKLLPAWDDVKKLIDRIDWR